MHSVREGEDNVLREGSNALHQSAVIQQQDEAN